LYILFNCDILLPAVGKNPETFFKIILFGGNMKRFVVMFLVVSFLVSGFSGIVFAEKAEAGSICAQAQMDATTDVNKVLWIGSGCLLGVIGILIGYVASPSVPASRIMGKSSEYLQAYTTCYTDKGKSEQGMNAIIGCGISSAVFGVIYLIAAASASSSGY
jgi:hypothetical protein